MGQQSKKTVLKFILAFSLLGISPTGICSLNAQADNSEQFSAIKLEVVDMVSGELRSLDGLEVPFMEAYEYLAGSIDVEWARTELFELVKVVSQNLIKESRPLAWEGAYRRVLQDLLRLAETDEERALLAYYLAGSFGRETPERGGNRLQLQYLDEALRLAEKSELGGEIHYVLGTVLFPRGEGDFEDWISVKNGRDAVSAFDKAITYGSAEIRQLAAEAKGYLLREEFSFRGKTSFLPEEDITLELTGLNLKTLEVGVERIWPLSLPGERIAESELPQKPSLQSAIVLRAEEELDLPPFIEEAFSLDIPGISESGVYRIELTSPASVLETYITVGNAGALSGWVSKSELFVYVYDSASGVPLADAMVTLSDFKEKELEVGMTNQEGFLVFQFPSGLSSEDLMLKVVHEGNPAILNIPLNEEVGSYGQCQELLLPKSRVIRTGSIQNLYQLTESSSGGKLEILDSSGTRLAFDLSIDEEGIRVVQFVVDEAVSEGPIYYIDRCGNTGFAGYHLSLDKPELDIALIGENRAEKNIFRSGERIRLAIRSDSDSLIDGQSSNYIKLTLSEITDGNIGLWGALIENEQVFLEEVIRYNGEPELMIDVKTPSLRSEDIKIWEVSLSSLDGEEVLASQAFSTVGSSRRLRINAPRKIATVGDPVEVDFDFYKLGKSPRDSINGSLVIYAETWKRQYRHRKKGSIIAESEYLSLPDRSLLGAAKTDFQLSQEGYITEEVKRYPIRLKPGRSSIEIDIQQSGYYRLDWVPDRRSASAYTFKENVHLWVKSENGSIDLNRSERTQFIVDSHNERGILIIAENENQPMFISSYPEVGVLPVQLSGAGGFFDIPTASLDSLQRMRLYYFANNRWEVVKPEFVLEEVSTDLLNAPYYELQIDGRKIFADAIDYASGFGVVSSEGDDVGLPWWETYLLFQLQASFVKLSAGQPVSQFQFHCPEPLLFSFLYPQILTDKGEELKVFRFSEVGKAQIPLTHIDGEASVTITAFTSDLSQLNSTQLSLGQQVRNRVEIEGPLVLGVADKAEFKLVFKPAIENFSGRGNWTLKSSEEDLLSGELSMPALELDASKLKPGDYQLEVEAQNEGYFYEDSQSIRVLSHDIEEKGSVLQLDGEAEKISFEMSTGDGVIVTTSGLRILHEFVARWYQLWAYYDPDVASLLAWYSENVLQMNGGDSFLFDVASDFDERVSDLSRIGNDTFSIIPAILHLSVLEAIPLQDKSIQKGAALKLRDTLLNRLLVESDIGKRTWLLSILASDSRSDNRWGPTRLEARSFLSTFEARDELELRELLFLVNTAFGYGFTEEVNILSGVIIRRLQQTKREAHFSGLDDALVFFTAERLNWSLDSSYYLSQALQKCAYVGEKINWMTAMSYFYLFEGLAYEGELDLNSTFSIQIENSIEERTFTGGGIFQDEVGLTIDEDSTVSISRDSGKDTLSVIKFNRDDAAVENPFSEIGHAGQIFERIFLEETLLRGAVEQRSSVLEEDALRVGDTLIETLIIETGDYSGPLDIHLEGFSAWEYLDEVRLSSSVDGLDVVYDMPTSRSKQERRLIVHMPESGRLVIENTGLVRWPGLYRQPQVTIRDPMTGRELSVGDDLKWRIQSN